MAGVDVGLTSLRVWKLNMELNNELNIMDVWIHKNFELGERVAKILLEYVAADSGTYILLSNVYASLGKFKEAAQVRAKLREEGVQKEPGCSSIEVKNEIHEFLLGDIRHPERETNIH
ncbi:putative pentatricopeptide repeat-containing protein, chloroplastic [Datura stramonium]|uniref:Pentatricopeptide repeat-containing protein, chloroplastic n=1 Tax=Datura stramonium TaxID=4076 RepID=A0ABS8V0Z3_DATST|nr:putative pentatricopeptide repeat-containing protein, chloroplastic [Datura stramonium]